MSPVQANTRMSDRRGTRAMSPRIRLPPSEGRVEGSRDAEDLVDPPGAAIDGFHDLANAPLPRRLCRPVAPDPQVTAFARRHEPRPGDADVARVEDTARGIEPHDHVLSAVGDVEVPRRIHRRALGLDAEWRSAGRRQTPCEQ